MKMAIRAMQIFAPYPTAIELELRRPVFRGCGGQPGPEAFAARLEQAGIAIVRVTAADVIALDALRRDEGHGAARCRDEPRTPTSGATLRRLS
jgi:hypothetical protein